MRLLLKHCFFIAVILCYSKNLFAQNTWGISGSNFAGVSNIDINPSNMVTSKLGWDINVAGFDANMLNNSFYTDAQFLIPTLFKNKIAISTSNTRDQKKLSDADFIIHDAIQKNTFVNMGANIKGPSFMYNDGINAYAITTAFRGGFSTFGLPQQLVTLGYENLRYPALQNVPISISKGVQASTMAWLEIGGSYARKLYEQNLTLITGGFSVKLLLGYAGGYGMSNGIDLISPYIANFTATDLSLDYGHAINSENKPIAITSPLGTGISADIGFTYIRKRPGKRPYYGCPSMISKSIIIPDRNYRWKLGVSLLDLGGINFSTKAQAFQYSHVSYSWDTINRVDVKTLAAADNLVYSNYAANGSAQKKTAFYVMCPTALSIQFDYNFNNLIYLNAAIIQRVVIGTQPSLARMNSIAITPRYETPFFELAMPVILNEYMYPNLGLMVRYQYFFIGSDQLASTLGVAPVYGISLYAGIKISHFGINKKQPKLRY